MTAAKRATITEIRRAVLSDVVRVTIALDSEVPFHEERLTGPSRIFIDFPATRAAASLMDQTLRFDGDADLVRQVRIGRHPNATRVVLDAAGVSSYSVYPIYNPFRLVIDCLRPVTGAPRLTAVAAVVAPLPASAIRLKLEKAIAAPRPAVIERPVAPTPLASRRIVRMNATLPSSTPLATAALSAAYVPPPLAGRRIVGMSASTLPSSTPLATAALSAAYVSPPLAGRRIVG